MTSQHLQLARQILETCQQKQLKIAAAESCTGGWVAKIMTDLAGSSAVFDRGFVTYSDMAKMEMLGVSNATLDNHGAVSEETVLAMASGALQHSEADMTVAISGIAGPGGGSMEKPVGTVWFAWAQKGKPTTATLQHFNGDRNAVRRQAVTFALERLLQMAWEH
jgi:nicotinamide-nucleotide amidase